MKFCLIAFSIFLIGESFALGKVSHLLVESLGDGVFQLEDGGKQNPISASTFLPQDTKLSVRPKSGIETLAAGYQFRFGSSTTFECNYESIELYSGSIFIRSRKITNSIKIIGPEVTIRLSGAGSCMMEVEPNGGFKFVGLLGKLISSIDETTYVNILPGDIVFTNLLEDTFSDKLVVDLDNLLQSSFLLSGFANSNSFLDSLKSVSKSQKLHMGKALGTTVGSANHSESFEIIKDAPEKQNSQSLQDSSKFSYQGGNYELSTSPPLQELLGRTPQRVKKVSTVPSSEFKENNISKQLPLTKKNYPSRPFPSKVLRGR